MYFIEEKDSRVVKLPYSYERRALGTLHTEIWKQRYACEDREPLANMMKYLDTTKYRLISNLGENH